MTPHLSSVLFSSSLLTFSMGFRQLNHAVARSGERSARCEFRRVTGISKSASHLESSRFSVARLRSIRSRVISFTEHSLGSSRMLTHTRSGEVCRSRRGGNAAALVGRISTGTRGIRPFEQ